DQPAVAAASEHGGRRRPGHRRAAGDRRGDRVRDHLGAGVAQAGRSRRGDRGARRRDVLRRADIAGAPDPARAHAGLPARGAVAQRLAVTDVLIVSLGSTGGWRASDPELAAAIRRAGATAELAVAAPQRDVRTYALTDFVWARAARAAAHTAIADHAPRAIV